jgi:hypothetical protein
MALTGSTQLNIGHPAHHHFRKATRRAQNHRGKTPGAGRRVQCGAQPDEASNTLTRQPATHNHASDSRARLHATADCLRIIRACCRCLFTDCLSLCQIADRACSWTCPLARTAHGQSAGAAAFTDWTRTVRGLGLAMDTDKPRTAATADCAWTRPIRVRVLCVASPRSRTARALVHDCGK